MASTKKQQKGDTAQAHGMPFLKLALGSGLVLVFFVAMGAGAQNLLKGNITKQNEIKQNADLVNRYGEAASDPAVADALRKAQGQQTTEELKEKSSAFEALQNGTFKPGSDQTMAIMHGYVPPNMPPAQAQILSRVLPKMPQMPHPPTPEDIARMAGERNSERTAIEPASPYIPYPDSFAKAHGIDNTRQMQRIPQQNWPGQIGMRMPNVPGMPVMGFGPGMGNGIGYGLSKAEIAAQNQRIAEECIRARFGPVDMPKLQPGHAAIAAQARKNADTKHIVESDHQSVVGICDASGNEITGIQYDPYGQPTVLHGGTVMPDFMFKGMYYHSRSGKYLTLHRVYDPKLGRWLSRDPLGEAAGTNLYAYCNNDPINYWDPLGLDALYGYGGIGGLHRGLFIERDNGQIVTINGIYSGTGLKSFTGNLDVRIRDDQPRPKGNLWSPVDAKPITTDQCKIDRLFENAKRLQNRLLPGNRPVPYSIFVPALSGGRTSNQVVPLLLRSADIPVPPQPMAPGYDIPFGDTDPGET